jgi:hypothetical protein
MGIIQHALPPASDESPVAFRSIPSIPAVLADSNALPN